MDPKSGPQIHLLHKLVSMPSALWLESLECSWLLSKSQYFPVHKQTSWFNSRFDCVDPKGFTLELICTKSSESNSWGRFIVSHPVSTPVSFRVSELPLGPEIFQQQKTTKWSKHPSLSPSLCSSPCLFTASRNSTSRTRVMPCPWDPGRAIDRRCHLGWERKTASMKRRSWIQHW